jgi:hypothetical protein
MTLANEMNHAPAVAAFRHDWTRAEIRALFELPFPELLPEDYGRIISTRTIRTGSTPLNTCAMMDRARKCALRRPNNVIAIPVNLCGAGPHKLTVSYSFPGGRP